MIERIVMSVLLALSVWGNIYQWRNDGVAERARWEKAISDRNEQIATLSDDLSRAFDAAEYARLAAVAEARGVQIVKLPDDVVSACSLPPQARSAINRIGGGGS